MDKVLNLKPPILIVIDSASAVFFRVLWKFFQTVTL